MKFGPRKPNYKKRIKARTTGKMKRTLKKSVNPLYGKKGMGWVNNPKKAAYNKVYNKTTFDAVPSLSKNKGKKKSTTSNLEGTFNPSKRSDELSGTTTAIGCFGLILLIASFTNPYLFILSIPLFIYSYQRTNKEKKERQELYKKEKEKQSFQLLLFEKLTELQDLMKRTENLKSLDKFFENINELFILKDEALDLLNHAIDRNYFEKDHLMKSKEEIETLTDRLIKDYIKEYEERSFELATRLKTEKGQRSNYQRSYEELYKYKHLFTPDLESYIEERWQII